MPQNKEGVLPLLATARKQFVIWFSNKEHKIAVVGWLGVVACFLMFGSLFEHIQMNLAGKTVPLANPILTIINCSIWAYYGWLNGRAVPIILPNVVGLVLGITVVITALLCRGGCL
jgi:uncharacterized protein with PQ loop repeat